MTTDENTLKWDLDWAQLSHLSLRKQSEFFMGKELCYGLNYVPQKRYTTVLTPSTSECVTLFGNKVFSDLTKLRWGQYSGPSSNVTGVLIERGNLDTDTHWGETLWKATSVQNAEGHQKPEENNYGRHIHLPNRRPPFLGAGRAPLLLPVHPPWPRARVMQLIHINHGGLFAILFIMWPNPGQ